MKNDRVLVTVSDPASRLWVEARADARSSFLPFAAREMIEGRVDEVAMPVAEWAKLTQFLATLPSGRKHPGIVVTDPPDIEAKESSPRSVAAGKLAEIVRRCGATSPYGGDVTREVSGRYYGVEFCRGSQVVGKVFVYSAEYVRVAFVSSTTSQPPDGLPAQDSRIFASVDDAAKFIALILANSSNGFAEAFAIPLRQPKARKP